MDHPLFDPKMLSDDDIIEKLQKSREYLAQQSQLGHDFTVTSIEGVVNALEAEKEARFMRTQEKENKDAIATSLEPIELGKIAEINQEVFHMDPADIARSYKK